MRNEHGQFVSGYPGRCTPVGTVRVRTRHKRGCEQRAWVKVAEPNVWQLRARVVWEQHHGPIPKGYGVHHKNENKLDDDIDNLELVTKKAHLAIHRATYSEKIAATITALRRQKRWSTKSATKLTGRHPNGCTCPLHT